MSDGLSEDHADEAAARIRSLMSGRTNRDDEAAILAILREAPSPELPGILARVSLRGLIGDVDDRWFGPKNRTALLALLTQERVEALPVAARADLIVALSHGRTSSGDELAIEQTFLATRGTALTELKNALDLGADHHDLQHIVFSDIDDAERRARILEHIAREAKALDARAGLKVLSDVDDTLYANWTDKRFPAKTVYPGVHALHRELDPEGRVSFVTARPRDRTGMIEKATHATLRKLGVAQPVVLSGSFRNLHSHASIARKKLSNFLEYEQLFPEFEFVFFGDSGQGDADFAAQMVEHSDGVRAALIHDVVASGHETRSAFRDKGVRFFDCYPEAAAMACELGLIDKAAVGRVWEAANEEPAQVEFDDEATAQARRAELARVAPV